MIHINLLTVRFVRATPCPRFGTTDGSSDSEVGSLQSRAQSMTFHSWRGDIVQLDGENVFVVFLLPTEMKY